MQTVTTVSPPWEAPTWTTTPLSWPHYFCTNLIVNKFNPNLKPIPLMWPESTLSQVKLSFFPLENDQYFQLLTIFLKVNNQEIFKTAVIKEKINKLSKYKSRTLSTIKRIFWVHGKWEHWRQLYIFWKLDRSCTQTFMKWCMNDFGTQEWKIFPSVVNSYRKRQFYRQHAA